MADKKKNTPPGNEPKPTLTSSLFIDDDEFDEQQSWDETESFSQAPQPPRQQPLIRPAARPAPPQQPLSAPQTPQQYEEDEDDILSITFDDLPSQLDSLLPPQDAQQQPSHELITTQTPGITITPAPKPAPQQAASIPAKEHVAPATAPPAPPAMAARTNSIADIPDDQLGSTHLIMDDEPESAPTSPSSFSPAGIADSPLEFHSVSAQQAGDRLPDVREMDSQPKEMSLDSMFTDDGEADIQFHRAGDAPQFGAEPTPTPAQQTGAPAQPAAPVEPIQPVEEKSIETIPPLSLETEQETPPQTPPETKTHDSPVLQLDGPLELELESPPMHPEFQGEPTEDAPPSPAQPSLEISQKPPIEESQPLEIAPMGLESMESEPVAPQTIGSAPEDAPSEIVAENHIISEEALEDDTMHPSPILSASEAKWLDTGQGAAIEQAFAPQNVHEPEPENHLEKVLYEDSTPASPPQPPEPPQPLQPLLDDDDEYSPAYVTPQYTASESEQQKDYSPAPPPESALQSTPPSPETAPPETQAPPSAPDAEEPLPSDPKIEIALNGSEPEFAPAADSPLVTDLPDEGLEFTFDQNASTQPSPPSSVPDYAHDDDEDDDELTFTFSSEEDIPLELLTPPHEESFTLSKAPEPELESPMLVDEKPLENALPTPDEPDVAAAPRLELASDDTTPETVSQDAPEERPAAEDEESADAPTEAEDAPAEHEPLQDDDFHAEAPPVSETVETAETVAESAAPATDFSELAPPQITPEQEPTVDFSEEPKVELVVDEEPEVVVDEGPEVVVDEASEAVVDEEPEVVVDEASEAVVDEEPEVVVDEEPEVVVDEEPEVVVDEEPEVVVDEEPEVVVDEEPEVVVDEAPEQAPAAPLAAAPEKDIESRPEGATPPSVLSAADLAPKHQISLSGFPAQGGFAQEGVEAQVIVESAPKAEISFRGFPYSGAFTSQPEAPLAQPQEKTEVLEAPEGLAEPTPETDETPAPVVPPTVEQASEPDADSALLDIPGAEPEVESTAFAKQAVEADPAIEAEQTIAVEPALEAEPADDKSPEMTAHGAVEKPAPASEPEPAHESERPKPAETAPEVDAAPASQSTLPRPTPVSAAPGAVTVGQIVSLSGFPAQGAFSSGDSAPEVLIVEPPKSEISLKGFPASGAFAAPPQEPALEVDEPEAAPGPEVAASPHPPGSEETIPPASAALEEAFPEAASEEERADESEPAGADSVVIDGLQVFAVRGFPAQGAFSPEGQDVELLVEPLPKPELSFSGFPARGAFSQSGLEHETRPTPEPMAVEPPLETKPAVDGEFSEDVEAPEVVEVSEATEEGEGPEAVDVSAEAPLPLAEPAPDAEPEAGIEPDLLEHEESAPELEEDAEPTPTPEPVPAPEIESAPEPAPIPTPLKGAASVSPRPSTLSVGQIVSLSGFPIQGNFTAGDSAAEVVVIEPEQPEISLKGFPAQGAFSVDAPAPTPELEATPSPSPEAETSPVAKPEIAPTLEPELESPVATTPDPELAPDIQEDVTPELAPTPEPVFEPAVETPSEPEIEPEIHLETPEGATPEVELAPAPAIEPTPEPSLELDAAPLAEPSLEEAPTPEPAPSVELAPVPEPAPEPALEPEPAPLSETMVDEAPMVEPTPPPAPEIEPALVSESPQEQVEEPAPALAPTPDPEPEPEPKPEPGEEATTQDTPPLPTHPAATAGKPGGAMPRRARISKHAPFVLDITGDRILYVAEGIARDVPALEAIPESAPYIVDYPTSPGAPTAGEIGLVNVTGPAKSAPEQARAQLTESGKLTADTELLMYDVRADAAESLNVLYQIVERKAHEKTLRECSQHKHSLMIFDPVALLRGIIMSLPQAATHALALHLPTSVVLLVGSGEETYFAKRYSLDQNALKRDGVAAIQACLHAQAKDLSGVRRKLQKPLEAITWIAPFARSMNFPLPTPDALVLDSSESLGLSVQKPLELSIAPMDGLAFSTLMPCWSALPDYIKTLNVKTTVTPKKETARRGFKADTKMWLLMLLLTACLAAAGWYFWQESQKLAPENLKLQGELQSLQNQPPLPPFFTAKDFAPLNTLAGQLTKAMERPPLAVIWNSISAATPREALLKRVAVSYAESASTTMLSGKITTLRDQNHVIFSNYMSRLNDAGFTIKQHSLTQQGENKGDFTIIMVRPFNK